MNKPVGSPYGDGTSQRDYTHVSDIVAGIMAALDYGKTPYELFNLGSGRRITLAKLVETLEQVTGKAAHLKQLPAEASDMPQTWADIGKAQVQLGYQPKTKLEAGLEAFVAGLNAQ